MQGSAAGLVRLVDLGAGAHQGHSALVPPVGSSVVQRCPAGTISPSTLNPIKMASADLIALEKGNSPSHFVPLIQVSTTT